MAVKEKWTSIENREKPLTKEINNIRGKKANVSSLPDSNRAELNARFLRKTPTASVYLRLYI